MARWEPARADVIGEYAAEVAGVFPCGRLLVGLDGIESPLTGEHETAREAFAADLAAAFRSGGTASAAVRLGDFLAGDELPEDPAALYDVAAFRERVLAPYRAGRPFEIASGGPGGDRATSMLEPGDRAVLVVSGAFSHLGELPGVWHQSAWLQIPRAQVRRDEAARLRTSEDDPVLERWSDLVDAAFRRVDARKLSNATFDLTDPAHPRRRFEDAC